MSSPATATMLFEWATSGTKEARLIKLVPSSAPRGGRTTSTFFLSSAAMRAGHAADQRLRADRGDIRQHCTRRQTTDPRPGRFVPIVRPLSNRSVCPRPNLSRCPRESREELFIGVVAVAQCYLNRAELTAERVVPNPFARTCAVYRPGATSRGGCPWETLTSSGDRTAVYIPASGSKPGESNRCLDNGIRSVRRPLSLTRADARATRDSSPYVKTVAPDAVANPSPMKLLEFISDHVPAYMFRLLGPSSTPSQLTPNAKG